MNTEKVKLFWYSHRSGESAELGEYKVTDTPEFKHRPIGRGSNFILVILDTNTKYKLPE